MNLTLYLISLSHNFIVSNYFTKTNFMTCFTSLEEQSLLQKTSFDFKVAWSNSKISPNFNLNKSSIFFYHSGIVITNSIKFTTIKLNNYTYLFDTILRFCPSKRNIDPNNSVPVYQNNWKCFKKSKHKTYKKFMPLFTRHFIHDSLVNKSRNVTKNCWLLSATNLQSDSKIIWKSPRSVTNFNALTIPIATPTQTQKGSSQDFFWCTIRIKYHLDNILIPILRPFMRLLTKKCSLPGIG